MDITIKVSEKAEQKIRRQAARNGKDVNEFVGEFVEEVLEEKFPESVESESEDKEYENPFTPFIGMFSSGKTDTSERMHEILYGEDFDSAEGFSIKND